MKLRRLLMFCKAMILILLNGTQWQLSDANDAKAAAMTCKRQYNSCLAKFTKVKTNTYRAICK